MKTVTFAASMALAVSLGWAAEKKDVAIKAPDGVMLKASYYSPGRPGPAMMLFHQCNMDRHAWDGLAKDLADAGFHVLTMDLRGFGESGGEKLTSQGPQRAETWNSDADAAYAYLLAQKGVDKSRIAAGGASCGVTLSSDLAARHHEIKALVLLSGGTSEMARAYLAATPSLPVFGAASEGDTNAAKGIKEAVEASKNPRSTLKIYPGTEHGVPMFPKHPDLEPTIVSWLKTQLAGQGGNL
jgi:dienelactone hydrolase